MRKRYPFKLNFNVSIHSNLDMGKGVSSSAALEISIVNAIASVLDVTLTDQEIIDICRTVDHDHVGINSGSLDYSASLLSKKNSILYKFKHWFVIKIYCS